MKQRKKRSMPRRQLRGAKHNTLIIDFGAIKKFPVIKALIAW